MLNRNLLLTSALTLAAAASSAEILSPIDMGGVANARFDSAGFINGGTYPRDSSDVLLDGVPYRLPSSGNYMWHSADPFTATKSVVIPVGTYGVDKVYTLMGTWWGENGAGSYAAIVFHGSTDTLTWVLDGGSEIRDYNYNPSYTTTLNPATVSAWVAP